MLPYGIKLQNDQIEKYLHATVLLKRSNFGK
jgi:hypothetical protein